MTNSESTMVVEIDPITVVEGLPLIGVYFRLGG